MFAASRRPAVGRLLLVACAVMAALTAPVLQAATPVAPTFQAFSAIAAAANGAADPTVTLPAHATNDILLLATIVRSSTATVATPAGWTQIGSPTVRGAVATYQFFWKRAASAAETNPLINRTGTTGDVYAAVITYRGAITTGNPWEVTGTVATGTTDPSVITGITTLTANALVVVAVPGEDNNNASIITTGTDPANYTEHYVSSATGADGVITFSEAARTTAGATGNASVNWDIGVPVGFGGIVLALKPLPVLNDFLVEAAGGGAIGTQAAGTPFNIRITARDQYGSTLTGFTGTVNITSTGTLSAGSGTTAAFTAGVLTSHSVTVSNTGSFTITATNSAGAETGTSNAFTVTAGALNNFLVESTTAGGGAAWYNAGWLYRKKITIDQTKVGSGGVANFPVLISHIDTDLQSKAQADGDDILFTSSDGTTKLSHEIERYVSSTGEVVAWVKVPSISSAAATEFYLYYGNASAASQQDAVNVWDANYRGVWHLPDGTTLTANDSTSIGGIGTVSVATAATGQMGGGASFNSATFTRITSTPSPNIGAATGLTLRMWARYDSALVAGNGHAFDIRNGTGTMAARFGAANDWQIRDLASQSMLPAMGAINGSWHLYSVVINGTTATSYVDGVQQAIATNASYSQPALNGTPCIGGAVSDGCAADVTNKYGGLLDEIRISNTNRSAAWLLTEYNSESSPSTFYSMATESAGPNPIGPQTAGTAFTIKITARDANFNTVTSFTGTVDLTSTGILSAGGGTTVSFTAGVLASTSVTISNAGIFTITATRTGNSETGTSNAFPVSAGAFTKMQILVPGETAAPGTATGKTGDPGYHLAGTPFTVTVNAVDANWNVVSSTNTVGITSSDAAATLPGNAALVAGTRTFSLTLNTVGYWTATATNITDGTKTADTSAVMSVEAPRATITTGSFVKTSGTGSVDQVVAHGLSGTPKALILWTAAKSNESFSAEAAFSYGFTDGTTSYSIGVASQNGVTPANSASRIGTRLLTIIPPTSTSGPLVEAAFSSWDATNFTITWNPNTATSDVIHYIAIGGTDVSAKVLNWQMATATGAQAVTGVGFQPTAVLHAFGQPLTGALDTTQTRAAFGLGVMDFGGGQWANHFVSTDGTTGADTQRGQQTDAAVYTFGNALAVQKKAAFTSMDSDGFTLNYSVANASVAQVMSLALRGVNVKAGSFLKSTNTSVPVSQAVTGSNFTPSVVMLSSVQDVVQASPVVHSRFGLGAASATAEGSSAVADADAVDPTSTQGIDKTSKAFMKVNNATSTIDAQADLASMDDDGFTLSWTTNDAVATEILYLALAPLAVTEVKLIAFEATRYDRGVLLQWKTGAELNNLGFNLYREVDGVRTKVNTALVAGSGLMAGQGTTVNAELTYARWDLDPAATSADVAYYLEDLDFNGTVTLHGPITPTAGALNAPVPTVATSRDLRDLGKRAKNRKILKAHDGDREVRRDGRRRAAPAQSARDTQWELAAQAAVTIGINRPGWYRVTQPELVAAGLDPRVDPRRLRLFVDGAEQAMRVIGQATGRFAENGAIEFYATGVDTPYTDTRVYWLVAGGQPGRRIQVTGNGGGGASVSPASFVSTVRLKERSIYFAALENGEQENWFGAFVSSEPTELIVPADHLDATAAGSAQLDVTLQGVTVGTDHRVGVLVNGIEVGELAFAGQTNQAQRFAIPADVLVEGDNTVTLVARGGEADFSLVDEIALSYAHTYRAEADRLRATVEAPGPVTIGGFASAAIRVVDITDPASARELAGAVGPEAGGFFSVRVRATGPGPRTLLAFSDATIASPVFVRAHRPSTWHAASQAHDWVAITHPDFLAQAQPLAALRQQQGYTPAIVDITDIYAEFSFGEKTPQAIRDFLQWARTNWRQAPRFVVLVGDATLDPRDYAGMGAADFVPTKHVPMSLVTLETASDDWFVDFDTNGQPDVAIGRLSVRTADQAAALVSKMISYDQQGLAPWTKNVLLVSGERDETTNFGRLSAELGAQVPPDYTVRHVVTDVLGGEGAQQALVDRVNQGQLLVNYTGHGSVQLWGGDGAVLSTSLVSSWENATRLPFVVAMNCLNGFFNQVWDEESLAEALQRAADGGAVAVWASSSVTPPATQALVNQELFRLIFQGAYATLGEAVVAAKQVVSNPDLRRSWIFFGDPAMRLNGAPQPVSTFNAAAASSARGADATAASDPAAPLAIEALLEARGEAVQFVDFTGEGRADLLLYAADSGRWSGVFNQATGAVLRAGTWGPAWQAVAANLNGDDRADLVFYRPATGEWVQALTARTGASTVTSGTLAVGAPQARLRVGDFDGNRRDDVLIYDPASGGWTMGLNDGRGGFTSRRGTWAAGLRVSVADFTGDGLADVFGYDAATGRGSLMVSERDGRVSVTESAWERGWRVTVAHLGGSADADLLFYNPASGAWQSAVYDRDGRWATRTGTWAAGLEIHATDLDADGRDDVFGYHPATGQWMTALTRPSGRFAAAVDGGSWTAGLSIATGDVNADGRGDVILYDAGTGLWITGVTVSPGVFAFESGSGLPGAVLVGRPR